MWRDHGDGSPHARFRDSTADAVAARVRPCRGNQRGVGEQRGQQREGERPGSEQFTVSTIQLHPLLTIDRRGDFIEGAPDVPGDTIKLDDAGVDTYL
jgi:hypothetical protein